VQQCQEHLDLRRLMHTWSRAPSGRART